METFKKTRRGLPGNAAAASSMGSIRGVNGAAAMNGATARFTEQGEDPFDASAASMILGRDEDPFDAMASSITDPSTLESYARNLSLSPNDSRTAKKHERKCKKDTRKKAKAEKIKAKKNAAKEKEEGDDIEDAEEITYTSYRPAKLKYGKDHPGELLMVLRVQSCFEHAL